MKGVKKLSKFTSASLNHKNMSIKTSSNKPIGFGKRLGYCSGLIFILTKKSQITMPQLTEILRECLVPN